MQKTLRLYWLALLAASSLLAQTAGPLTIDPPQKVVLTKGQSATVKLHVKLAPGHHTNSNTPSEDYLIPLRFTMAAEPLVLEGVVYPKGHDEKYSFAEKPLNVLTGEFDILVKLKAPATAQPQMHVLVGKLRYQACTDKMCLSPKTVEVRLTADVR
jgi:thioredoxin:protein disulfide reductase